MPGFRWEDLSEDARVLAQAIHDMRGALGFDLDGDKTPAAEIAGMGVAGYALHGVKDAQESAKAYDEAIHEKAEILVIEHPQEDPTWAILGDESRVEVATMSTYAWSSYAMDGEAYQATEDYLQTLRDGVGSEAFRAWLRPWLEEQVDERERDFTVDWTALTINPNTEEDGA